MLKMLILTRKNSPNGFTVVELLIVIVVIAILAAITLVTYAGIQQQAAGVTLQPDLHNAATQLELTKQTQGEYPNDESSLQKSQGTTFQYTSSGQSYCLSATSDRSGVPSYRVSSDIPSVQEGTCSILIEVAASGSRHVCAVTGNQAMTCWGQNTYGQIGNNSAVYCWGRNNFGQLGNGTTDNSPIPSSVALP